MPVRDFRPIKPIWTDRLQDLLTDIIPDFRSGHEIVRRVDLGTTAVDLGRGGRALEGSDGFVFGDGLATGKSGRGATVVDEPVLGVVGRLLGRRIVRVPHRNITGFVAIGIHVDDDRTGFPFSFESSSDEPRSVGSSSSGRRTSPGFDVDRTSGGAGGDGAAVDVAGLPAPRDAVVRAGRCHCDGRVCDETSVDSRKRDDE